MTYRTTEQADRDISDIFLHGAQKFGVSQAEDYQDGLFRTFQVLADHPHMSRERMEFGRPVRLHPYQAHIVVYAIQDDIVLIVRVLHGRQDWERWI